MLLNHVFLYEHLWSLLFNVLWTAMGKPGHFCYLLVGWLLEGFFLFGVFYWFFCLCFCFFFLNPGGNDSVFCYCYPVSITLHSSCASSHSQSLHSPICSQCHCICPCRHYLVFIFCWLLNRYWAANLQIMAYRMPIYQKYFTIYSWFCQSEI